MTFGKEVPLSEQRLRVAMAKSKRSHGKRHAVGKRTAAQKRKARSVARMKIATYRKMQARMLAGARAYWRGESDVLVPGFPSQL